MEPELKFKLNDIVSAYSDEHQMQMDAQIIAFRHSNTKAYIHFLKQDKRLDKWVDIGTLLPAHDGGQSKSEEHVMSRSQKRRLDGSDEDEEVPSDFVQFEKIHKEVTKIRNIDQITIGNYTIKTWYFSPYPHPYFKMDHIYICEQCFHYFGSAGELQNHQNEKHELCPPGREIYREGNLSVFELKGWRQKLSCQCLCLLSKLFLDHKTLFYDVEGFVFYVLCECDSAGAHIAAYFSRELHSSEGNILACITTLPPYQKKGYGHLLISLAYEIARRQHRSGGPERPLSDLGKIAFHSYWRDTILTLLRTRQAEITTIDDLVTLTAIDHDDVIETLKELNCVMKVKGEYELSLNRDSLAVAFAAQESARPRRCIDPSCLIWLPGDDDH